MKQRFCLTALLTMAGFSPAAQPSAGKPDTSEIRRHLTSADQYLDRKNFDSAFLFASSAAEMALSYRFPKFYGQALLRMTESMISLKNYTKARELAGLLHQAARQANDTMMNAIALLFMGQVKMYQDQPDDAILLMDKSIAGGLGAYPSEYLALAYNDLGHAWGLKDEYERQAQFTHKALDIYGMLNDDVGLGMTLGNLSTVYYYLGQKEKAIEYGKQSLKYREKVGDYNLLGITCCNLSQYYLGINLEEAVKYKELCVKYAQLTNDQDRLIQSYITAALVENARKNNKEAFQYELKVIDMLERSGANDRMLSRRYIAAAIYSENLRYDSSLILGYYSRAISLSARMNDRSNLRDLYLYLSEYHRKQKQFGEAYANYKKHILYRDSLVNFEKEQKIAELESRYEANRKDMEIARLNNEQKIKQLEIEKQKAIISGNTAVALQKQNEIDLLSKTRELQEAKIKQQDEELVKKELISTAREQQLQLAEKEKQLRERSIRNEKILRNGLIAGLVLVLLLGYLYFNRYQLKKKLEQQKSVLAMRNTISQDLHDDIGASLSNINILNELARRNMEQPEKSQTYLTRASEDIQRISESLSDIVWTINPRYDDVQNLFVRMKRYAADMLDGKNIRGDFEFPPAGTTVPLSMTQRRDLYLIFKEAVNNLVKYSGASHARIRLSVTGTAIRLQVDDDGRGFDPGAVKEGNGLLNMSRRAKVSGGIFSIRSATGQGTVVTLELQGEG